MPSFLTLCHSRLLSLLGACALAMTQAACAHPTALGPSVTLHAHAGGPVYASVHGAVHVPLYPPMDPPVYPQMHVPPAVLLSPAPIRVVPAPPMWAPAARVVPVRPWVYPAPHAPSWGGPARAWGHRGRDRR